MLPRRRLARGGRLVGDHDVERVRFELRDESLVRVFDAHDVHHDRGLEDPVRDDLRHRLGHAHHQTRRLARRTPARRVDEVVAEREDLVGKDD